jgi:uncharacterized protein YndB with AHSA1/START domain
MTAIATRAQVTLPTDREIHIVREFDAPRERVWRAMTDPALVAQWWGRGNKLVVERLELRRGGHWRFVEHAGSEVHGFEGRFAEVSPPERVVQTFEWDGLPGHPLQQTMMLDALPEGRTRLTVTIIFFTTQDRDGMIRAGMEGGMNESHAALDRVLAAMK